MAAGCTLKGNGSAIDLSTMVLLLVFPVYGFSPKITNMKRRTNKIKKMMTAGLVCTTMILTVGCAEQTVVKKQKAESLPVIVVGSDNYPPFNYLNADGDPTGIDVELAKEAFYRMGYEAEFKLINWEDKKELLESGEIDCIWGSFSMDGREEEYQWAGPYMTSYQVIAVRTDSDIYSLQDLEGKTVAVQSTTKPEEIFRKHEDARIPQLGKVLSLRNRDLIYTFLSKGYADAVAAHDTAVKQFMKDYDMEYRILEEPLLVVGLGVAFDKKDDRGLAQKLTETFEEMREDGTMKEIVGTYMEDTDGYLEVRTDET